MSYLDIIQSEHCYDVTFTNDYGKPVTIHCITNLKLNDDKEQMKRDLSYLFGRGVINFKPR
ncbi:hypothetical protein [Acinetobacter sp. Ver3]|uniref:hypothetical protein n=1 Tax=Acinetobacter sp. Ver3 TaxID=466088 RepID=UPI000446D64B|nr:hypothetical protein [Acinetobacter sp. Ver3]EZQ12163.1 hypothetical protein CL42_01955 [Acinetobacter sp. Ver3]